MYYYYYYYYLLSLYNIIAHLLQVTDDMRGILVFYYPFHEIVSTYHHLVDWNSTD